MAVAEILSLIEKLPLREQLDIADHIYEQVPPKAVTADEACVTASGRIEEMLCDPSVCIDHDEMMSRLRASFP